jgi:hypothetical protein
MTKLNYDDPAVNDRWCEEQRGIVLNSLRWQKVKHGRVGARPAWHVAPYVSIWAIESVDRPEWIGWWAICGDLPTDYISSADVEPPQHPRKAMRVIGQRWLEMVAAWKDGRNFDDAWIAGSSSHDELVPLLEARASLLMKWADDDAVWEES